GVRRYCCPADDPPFYAMKNRREPEEVKGHVEIPIIDAQASHLLAISGDIFVFGWNFQATNISPSKPRNYIWRHSIHHGMESEVCSRLTKARKLPIEHAQNLWFGEMKDHIVAAEIAVKDRSGFFGRNII